MYTTNMEMDMGQLQTNANTIKEILLEGLEKEGLLKGTAKEIGSKYAVVAHKKGWLGKLLGRLFNGAGEGMDIKVTLVKIVE